MMDEAFDDLALRLEARVGLTLKDKWRLDHLLGVGGPGNDRRPGRDLAGDGPADSERPPITPGLGTVLVEAGDLGESARRSLADQIYRVVTQAAG